MRIDLNKLLKANPVLGGGAALAVGGGLLGAGFGVLRGLYRRAQTFFWDRVLLTVTVTSDDDAYQWLQRWFADHPKAQRVRNLQLQTRWATEREEEDLGVRGQQILLTPGLGDHFYRWNRMWFWVNISREKVEAGGSYGRGGRSMGPYVDTMKLRIARGGREDLCGLLESIQETFQEELQDRVKIKENQHGDWHTVSTRRQRSLESLVFSDGMLTKLVEEVKQFDHERQWYIDHGVPHRRGYLLHGPPGNGKSSLAFAVAGATDRDVYLLNLAASGLGDGELRSLLANLPTNALVLLEDIDAVCEGREVRNLGLTFSGVLNALDGVASAEGRVLFMTSNHPDLLDAALVRPGRVDMRLLIDNANPHQAHDLFLRFFPGAAPQAQKFASWAGNGQHSMAQLQEKLVSCRHDTEAAACA